MDLKEVVQQQQVQLEHQQDGPQLAEDDWRLPAVYAAPDNGAPEAAPAKPHIAQLQRLVRDMRAELRQPLPGDQGLAAPQAQAQQQQKRQFVTSWGGPGGGGGAGQGPVAPLVAAGQHQHQQQKGGNVQQQQQQVQQQAELEAALREAECARGERERLRRALIDAEIELQVCRVALCVCARQSVCAWMEAFVCDGDG